MTTVQAANQPAPFAGAVADVAAAAQSQAAQQNNTAPAIRDGIAPVVNQAAAPAIQNAQQPAAAQEAPQPFATRIFLRAKAPYEVLRNKFVQITDRPLGERFGQIFRNFVWTAVIWFPSNFIFKTWVTVACVTAYGIIHVISKKPYIFSENTYKFIHTGFGWAAAIGTVRNVVLSILETNAELSAEYRMVAFICAAATAVFYKLKNKAPEVVAQPNQQAQAVVQQPVQQPAPANQVAEQQPQVQQPVQPTVLAQPVAEPQAQQPAPQPLPVLPPMTTAPLTTAAAQVTQTAANTTSTPTIAVLATEVAAPISPVVEAQSTSAATTAPTATLPAADAQTSAKTDAARRTRRNRWKQDTNLPVPQPTRTRHSPRTAPVQAELAASSSTTTTANQPAA